MSRTRPLSHISQAERIEGGFAVRKLKAKRWPHRLVFWDTEGLEEPDGYHYAVGHARLYLRQPDGSYDEAVAAHAYTPAALWDLVDSWTRRKEGMRLYAHNHTFDLGLSHAMEHLWDRLGYRGTPGKDLVWSRASYEEGSEVPFLALRRSPARAKIVFCDGLNLLHTGIKQLATDLGLGQQPPLEDLEARCEWDTMVLAHAVLHYFGCLRDAGCTPEALTGTGHGFALLRRLHLAEGEVIHHLDPALYEAERASMYGGRREGWRHGAVAEKVEDWDYEHAHANICLQPLPSKPRDPVWAQLRPSAADTTSLAWWLVETEVPCTPYRDPGRGVVYPTGRFPALLWGPEAALAMDMGATVRPCGSRWEYQLVPALATWAEWILEQLATTNDPVWHRVLKRWSHTMVGKWAQHNARYEKQQPRPYWPPEWQTGPFVVSTEHGNPQGYDRMLWSDAGVYGIRDDAYPAEYANLAIYSYVTALCRVQLWRAMWVAGLGEIVYCNGDGLGVTRLGGDRLRRACRGGQLPGLRRKGTYQLGVDVWNAQAVIDRDVKVGADKVAGLPGGSERIGPHHWATTTWHQGLLRRPERRPGVWVLPPGPLGRSRQADGRTGAYRVAR